MWNIEKNGADAFFIKDGRFFKIDNDAYLILDLLNRQKTIEQISRMTNIQADDIITLLEDLDRIGKTNKSKRKKFHPILLILPHKLSRKVGGVLSCLFSKASICTALLISLFSIGVLVVGSSTLISPANQVSIVAYIGSLFIVSILHELGHISAACRIKLEGSFDVYLGIYTFLFTFYVDDLNYLYLRGKKERLLVNSGGIYFQLLLFIIIAFFLYLRTEPNFFSALFWINTMLLLFNIFPFFATDGYWILSDYIAGGELNKQCGLISRDVLRLHVTRKYPPFIWVYWILRSFLCIWILVIWAKVIWHRILNASEMYYIVMENPLEPYTIVRVFVYLLPLILPIVYIYGKTKKKAHNNDRGSRKAF